MLLDKFYVSTLLKASIVKDRVLFQFQINASNTKKLRNRVFYIYTVLKSKRYGSLGVKPYLYMPKIEFKI